MTKEQAIILITRIASNLTHIFQADMSQAELNIMKLLVENKVLEWQENDKDTGEVIALFDKNWKQ